MSSRAVGSAIGKNPISIIVPCHRVIGKNGALTGYAGGIDKKRFLLNLENKEWEILSSYKQQERISCINNGVRFKISNVVR